MAIFALNICLHIGLDHHPADDDGVAHLEQLKKEGAGPQGHRTV